MVLCAAALMHNNKTLLTYLHQPAAERVEANASVPAVPPIIVCMSRDTQLSHREPFFGPDRDVAKASRSATATPLHRKTDPQRVVSSG